MEGVVYQEARTAFFLSYLISFILNSHYVTTDENRIFYHMYPAYRIQFPQLQQDLSATLTVTFTTLTLNSRKFFDRVPKSEKDAL
jgi:hypothetical protein